MRLLRPVCDALLWGVGVWALLLLGIVGLLWVGGYRADFRALAFLSAAIALSVSRPHYRHGIWLWLLYDGAVLMAMLLAFSGVSEMLAIILTALMRMCGYANVYSMPMPCALLPVLAFMALVLLGSGIPVYVSAVISLAVWFGGMVSIMHCADDDVIKGVCGGQGLDD